MATWPPSSGIIGNMFSKAKTMLMVMSNSSRVGSPSFSACAPRLPMPMIETGRGLAPGLFAASVGVLGVGHLMEHRVTPWGEKMWPMPATSAVVTCHMVLMAAPGADNRLTDVGSRLDADAEVPVVGQLLALAR